MDLFPFSIGIGEDSVVSIKNRYIGTLVLGKSGTGKSVFMLNQWFMDSLLPYSQVMVEPTGELSLKAYKASRGKAHYCSLKYPIPMNPMASIYGEEQISDTIAEIINQLIQLTTPNEKLTSKMRAILDEAVKYCLVNNRRSLINVRDYIANLKGDKQTRDGIIQRLNFILSDERLHPILCGPTSINWSEFTRKGQKLIVDCSGMGRDKMVFMGSIVTHGLVEWFRYTGGSGYPIALYIDEAQNYFSENMYDLIFEGRKYGIGICLATQSFAMFPKDLMRAVLNIGNILCFRVGHREADLIGKELCTDSQTLQQLPNYHLAVMNDEEVAIVKASSPPYLPKIQPQVKPKATPVRWFTLEPYQPKEPTA